MPPKPDEAAFPGIGLRYSVAVAPVDIAFRDAVLQQYRVKLQEAKDGGVRLCPVLSFLGGVCHVVHAECVSL